jgi:hypothetical protein
MKGRERERGIVPDFQNENLATLQLSVPIFQISRDETLDNKPIIFVLKRVKTRLRQCRIQKFSGEDPGPPLQGERKGAGKVEEGGEGRGWGGRKGRA